MTPGGGEAVGVGVLGATSFVYRQAVRPAVDAVDGVRVVHEASRGGQLAPRDGVTTSDDYPAVLADDDVDLVYVPLPNHLHEEWVVACAAAGKHVLCEKPLAPDAGAARRMVDACAQAGVVLLEAYMSPFHARSAAVQQAVADGAVGTLRDGVARMTGTLADDDHRWWRSSGGGALLDVGIYCLEPMLTAAGWDGQAPRQVAAASRWSTGPHGDPDEAVDAATSAWLELADGTTLALHVDLTAPDQQLLQLTGDSGAIHVERHATPGHADDGYDLRAGDGTVTRVETATGDCYEGLVDHVRDVVTGADEPVRPPSRSVAVAQLLDRIAEAARS